LRGRGCGLSGGTVQALWLALVQGTVR
jgi:hypothetical protein